jgi:hypothetical protein
MQVKAGYGRVQAQRSLHLFAASGLVTRRRVNLAGAVKQRGIDSAGRQGAIDPVDRLAGLAVAVKRPGGRRLGRKISRKHRSL